MGAIVSSLVVREIKIVISLEALISIWRQQNLLSKFWYMQD